MAEMPDSCTGTNLCAGVYHRCFMNVLVCQGFRANAVQGSDPAILTGETTRAGLCTYTGNKMNLNKNIIFDAWFRTLLNI